jgi:hypothetical protein
MSKRTPLVFDPEKQGTRTPAAAQAAPETAAPRTVTKGKGRQGRQFIAAHVVPEAAKQFKLLAVQQGRTTQALLVEAINDLFVKYGLSRIADDE